VSESLPSNTPLATRGSEERTRELPGGTVIWIFVALELLTFGLFFIASADARRSDPTIFGEGASRLHTLLGAINTGVLLTGGLFVAQAVLANARGAARSTSVWLWGAAASGVVFMGIKLYEYADVLNMGVTLSTNRFWFFYLFITGLHFLHVLAGVFFLVPTAWRASGRAYGPRDATTVEAVAIFWHLVDLIWVFVFPLFYLGQRT